MLHIYIQSISRLGGGLTTSVSQITHKLADSTDIKYHYIRDKFTTKDAGLWNFNSKVNCFDTKHIRHFHGLWNLFSVFGFFLRLLSPSSVFIVSPHGMLDKWALNNSHFKKILFFLFFEKFNLKKSDCIHALCRSEYDSIRSLGIKSPVAIIPNAVSKPTNNYDVNYPDWYDNDLSYILYLGRIDKKKGILEFLQNFLQLIPKFPNHNIVIAGWGDDNYLKLLKHFVVTNAFQDRVIFYGSAFGEEKHTLYSICDYFVLPSFSEGLPMTILEAWSYSLPVLMTEECNLPIGFDTNSAFLYNYDIDSLDAFLSLSSRQLDLLAYNGSRLVNNFFSIQSVSLMYSKMYDWLSGKGPMPDFVHTD